MAETSITMALAMEGVDTSAPSLTNLPGRLLFLVDHALHQSHSLQSQSKTVDCCTPDQSQRQQQQYLVKPVLSKLMTMYKLLYSPSRKNGGNGIFFRAAYDVRLSSN
ncbi:hypothetical protein Ddye_027900 [Dipteronia dyeriana]|uniref:Uncharacterized protein n=1 Tax=Dipteronia dyeriana TaxID=168575 RepID=A0AAD9TQW8_9ROSI|nr:hypothetical protein Ddye_027900 [Dipteronia dyeriana]